MHSGSSRGNGRKRGGGWLAEEVIQTSAMDCGPAALKSLLAAYGLVVDYDRLRELCRTGVDGTSIDTLEDLANDLGVALSQYMVPVDALDAFTSSGPFVAVVRTAYGGLHFDVVWRGYGPVLQVMDSSVGRRWFTRQTYERRLSLHELAFSGEAWLALSLESPWFSWLERRAQRLGAPNGFLAGAIRSDGWRGLSAADATLRIVERLVSTRALSRARAADSIARTYAVALGDLERGFERRGALPRELFPAVPLAHGDATEDIRVCGAVVLAEAPQAVTPASAGVASRAPSGLLETPEALPWRAFLRLFRGLALPLVVGAFAATLAALGALVEAALFRAAFTLVGQLRVPLQGALFAAMLVAFLGALLVVEVVLAAIGAWAGRFAEGKLRVSLLQKIPRLGDGFFRSRSISDLAQRAQSLDVIRTLPPLVLRVVRITVDLALTAVALCILDPPLAPWVLASLAVALAVPVLSSRLTFERDAKLAAHSGALSTAYLDALRGVVPIRTHRAEHALRVEHEHKLVGWYAAARGQQSLSLWTTAAQLLVGALVVTALVFFHVAHSSDGQRLLLLFFWAQRFPTAGLSLVAALRAFSSARAILLRIQEPLRADETAEPDEPVRAPNSTSNDAGAAVSLRRVSVKAGGHEILKDVSCSIASGERVAIVGRSGAGKSSLVGLLLGWHRADSGDVLVDGEPLSEGRTEALRAQIAWVDPAILLWNAPLIDNIVYGSERARTRALASVVEQADLVSVLERLPQGLATRLGEGGALVSGGEGQRVRFARAACRYGARLVLLDEAFRGLDREKRRTLLSRVHELWPRATLLCVTHDVGDTGDFDRILVVEDGRIIEDGAPNALLAGPSQYRTLVEADRAARATLWEHEGFRRVRIENGKVMDLPGALR